VTAPTQASIAATTASELRAIYAQRFRPDQVAIVAVGDFENDKMLDLLKAKLKGWKAPASAPAPAPARIVSLGVVLFSYLRLKLHLRASGFAVEFHDYDWRLPVGQLGAEFAARLCAAAPARVAIVAHSMGGLLARAALAHRGMAHLQRVVLLGTPNLGSFAAVQALRGTYAVVRKVARLVADVSAETLTREVFSSFPSLYDLLPSGGAAELLDLAHWPTSGCRPRAELLRAARAARHQYAPADERFAVIAGTGKETVTAVTRRRDEFIYTLTRQGDGTVPTASAVLSGARCAYARVAHSELTRDPVVATAVVDLLKRGQTTRLPQQWRNASRACVRVGDRQLQRSHVEKVDWSALTPEQRRLFLENLNEPPHLKLHVPRTHARGRRRGTSQGD
jgi:pimeloyl-ACP methyl ester carboxylesterase